HERSDLAAKIEGAARAITESALDANLFVESRRIATAKNRIRHLRDEVRRIDALQPRTRRNHRRLPGLGHVDDHHTGFRCRGGLQAARRAKARRYTFPRTKLLLRQRECS